MTIKNILIRNAGLIIVLLSIVITAQLVLNNLQNRELQLKATSDQIVHDASSLILLTSEWHNFDTVRISRQWKLKYSQLKSLIDQKNDKYAALQEDLATLESNFNELMQTNKQLEQELPLNQLRVLTDKQKWLVTRNRVTSQAIVDKTNIISAQTMQKLKYLHQLSSWLMAGFLVVISLVMYIFSRRIIRRITQPLELLYNEVQKIESGDFSGGFNLEDEQKHFIRTRETHVLARAMNTMLNRISSIVTELQEQNTYIQTILDNIPLGVAVSKYDEGSATYINRQFEEIYGWPKDDLVNVEDFFEKVYPDKAYRKTIQQRIFQDIASGDPDRMRWENIQITTQAGETKIVNARNISLEEQNLMISTVHDVTELVNIRKDRDRIFENSIDMVCTASLDGYLLTLNPAWEKVLGWSQQELKAKPFIEFVHPDDLEHTLSATKGLNEGKPALGFENRYRTKEGVYKCFSWNTIPIPEENMMLGIARDITEKKENEEKIKQSEEKFSTIFKNSPDAILLSSLHDGKIIELNNSTTDILGYSYAELIGKNTTRFRLWKSLEDRNTYVEKLVQSGRVIGFETSFIVKSGEEITCKISGELINISGENYILNILQDITEMKKVQDELIRSQQQLKNTTNNIPGAIVQFKRSPGGQDELIYVSGGASEIWGISPEDATQNMKQVWNSIHRDDLSMVKESIAQSFREMGPWNIEFRNNLPDGKQRWTQGIGIPQKLKDGSVVWDSLLLDITQRKKAELSLRDYQEELQKLTIELSVTEEKHRKEIAANIHDHLSQSLVISKMKINDLLNERALKPYTSVLNYVKKHISEALENSRKITYDLSPPVLYEMGIVETMYWLVEKTEEETGLKMEFSTDFDALQLPEAAMILLYRSIQEIIYNVIKHAEASTLSVQFSAKDEGLEILIHDNGKGFNVPDIWSTRARKGFGLFAVQERIQNLHGRFSIESTPGIGTTVKFYIPLSTKASTHGN